MSTVVIIDAKGTEVAQGLVSREHAQDLVDQWNVKNRSTRWQKPFRVDERPLSTTIDDRQAERRLVLELGRMYSLWQAGEATSPSDLDCVLAGDAVLTNMDPVYAKWSLDHLGSPVFDCIADEVHENAEGLNSDECLANFIIRRLREVSS